MFHCHVWKPDGIWNWQMKLEDPEGQAILSPVSTPKCSMHTGPTVFFFCWSSFLSLPGLFLKASKQKSSDLRSESYLQVRHLFTKYSPSPPDFLLFLKKKGKQFSHWGVVSAIPIPDTPTEVPDWQVLPLVIWEFPRKAGHLANQTGAFSKKNDLSRILKQQCRFNTPGNWWFARKLTNHRSKVAQSLTSNRVVLKFP